MFLTMKNIQHKKEHNTECILRRHDTQHNDTKHNDTQHKDTQHNDIQHKH